MTTEKNNDFGGQYLVQDQNHMGESRPVTVKAVHGASRQIVRPSIRQHQVKRQSVGSRKVLAATA